MKIENGISWCDATVNALTGCDKVSPGCKNCYAEAGTRARVLRAQGRETWGSKGERVPVNFEPVFKRLNKLCVCSICHEAHPFNQIGKLCQQSKPETRCKGMCRRIRLFADSNSDWLDPKWPVETLAKFLDAIRLAPNVDVLLLTKRIEKFRSRFSATVAWAFETGHGDLQSWLNVWLDVPQPPANIWLGVSVEDQKRADELIPLLLKIPAAVRFLSVEPLLEKIDIGSAVRLAGFDNGANGNRKNHEPAFDWVIVGGESGPDRRDCGVEAIESVVQQCANAGVPCYCKQDSHFKPGQKGRLSDNAWSFKEFPR